MSYLCQTGCVICFHTVFVKSPRGIHVHFRKNASAFEPKRFGAQVKTPRHFLLKNCQKAGQHPAFINETDIFYYTRQL